MSEDKAVAEMNLEALPRSINGTHDRLRTAMKQLCVLEDFLFGSQFKEVSPDKLKEPDNGVLHKCFNGVDEMNCSIREFHDKVESILSRLGAQEKPPTPELKRS